MYKLVVYVNSMPVGYVFVEDIRTRNYSSIRAEIRRALRLRKPFAFMLAD